MRCPYCNHPDSRVIDSRDAPEGVRRRRECTMCGLRFTTYERIQTTALMVAKRDGRREEYNRDKLTRSVQMACVKRPLPTGAIDKLVDDIESQLQALGRAEIPSVAIGEMVIERLRALDPVAYIRFASVYRDFADVERFRDAVEALESAKQALENGDPSPQLPLMSEEPPRRRRGRRPRSSAAGLPMDIGGGSD
ncbi:MAG: transcriptional regulator NrdR [Chloroflexota bacterium]|nr:transcriptional regulator NrdR [Chloroflexota bacterium]MDE2941896.1 transcriptional regulator NrdR [Chloroflexota bacterium]MDE3268367.1 transcriptional regulator NrdR [Chloroflexota bacterium]